MNFVFGFALNGSGGGEVGGFLERLDELGPAIGVAAIVNCVDADKDIKRTEDLGPGKCGIWTESPSPALSLGTSMAESVSAEPPN